MENGILLVDKAQNMTSHDVVARVRRLVQQKEVGHCGTLDPMATGLLVILLGKATKLSDFLLKSQKTYQTEIKFGVTSDTLDRTGQIVISDSPVSLTQESLISASSALTGQVDLPIPIFSAKKMNGKKLYELARAGIKIDRPMKSMNFFNVEFHSFSQDLARFQLSCSKGGFIRSWAEAMGEKLKTGAIMNELRRTKSKPFDLSDALTLEKIQELLSQGQKLKDFSQGFTPLSSCLPHWKKVNLQIFEEKLLKNGQVPRTLSSRLVLEQKKASREGQEIGIRAMSALSGELVSLLEAVPGRGIRIRRSFPT